MEAKNARELIEKYQEGTALPEEVVLIEKWIILGTVKDLDLSDEDLKSDFSIIRSQLPLKYEETKQVGLWRYIGVAAAVVAITLGLWWYTSRHYGDGHRVGQAQYTMDIAPGKNTATLTLPNGKTIVLSDDKVGLIIGASNLTYNDGTELLSSLLAGTTREAHEREIEASNISPNYQTLTATTPRGGTYQLTLSDGTNVWLNADSKISFPSKFVGSQRKVMLLNGEAYFEVAKDKKHPFIVLTDDQELEVLGTHFNISAYGEENITKTTLLEGSVQVSLLKKEKPLALKNAAVKLVPGQQAILSNHKIEVAFVNTGLAIDWKNGDFVFRDEGLESVMRKVARWYNVEIIYKIDYPQNVKLGGFISRSKDLSAVLRLIEATGKVHFDIKGKSIIVGK
uniref:FecR family protein n=1 Tax=Pedobacter schmidteae TaxID=2201271 RepID=UPI000EAE3F40|nr:FecR domain-containing protein [Pedobacter schmidteae]